MQLTAAAHVSQLTEVSYKAAVEYKEQGFTVLGRTKHSHIAHRITGSLTRNNEWYEYYIYPAEHCKPVTTEPTFKLICYNTAVQLYEAGHTIYWRCVDERIISQCLCHPNTLFIKGPTFYITTELHNKLMNKRTPQQALVESRPAQEAWLAGKPLQYKHISQTDYKDYSPSSNIDVPYFLDPSFHWRPKPEPEKVPFNQQTIPADAWFRFKGTHMFKLFTLSETGVRMNGEWVTYTYLVDHAEYSTDRINWQPCYTLKA